MKATEVFISEDCITIDIQQYGGYECTVHVEMDVIVDMVCQTEYFEEVIQVFHNTGFMFQVLVSLGIYKKLVTISLEDYVYDRAIEIQRNEFKDYDYE